MATEIRYTVWTSHEIDSDVAHAIAANLTQAVRSSGDTQAEVVAVEVTPIEPADIPVAVEAFEDAATPAEIIAGLECEVLELEAEVEFLKCELEEAEVGESGYPADDEPIHDDDRELTDEELSAICAEENRIAHEIELAEEDEENV